MSKATMERIVREIEGIPTLPEIYTRVTEMLENPKVSASDISDVLSQDPALTAKLLKIVNSAFYGLPQQVSTLTHALVLLGFSTVKSVVLATSLARVFGDNSSTSFDRSAFWTHCFGTGMIAKSLAIRTGYQQVEEVFIQGLLHDIGKIVLDHYAADEFAIITDMVEAEDILLVEAEETVLGFTHTAVGYLVARRWNLPRHICDVLRYHHQPDLGGDIFREASMVHLADIICRSLQIGSGGDRRIPVLSAKAWAVLHLERSVLSAVMQEATLFNNDESLFL